MHELMHMQQQKIHEYDQLVWKVSLIKIKFQSE
jgi:hypothetical protein